MDRQKLFKPSETSPRRPADRSASALSREATGETGCKANHCTFCGISLTSPICPNRAEIRTTFQRLFSQAYRKLNPLRSASKSLILQ